MRCYYSISKSCLPSVSLFFNCLLFFTSKFKIIFTYKDLWLKKITTLLIGYTPIYEKNKKLNCRRKLVKKYLDIKIKIASLLLFSKCSWKYCKQKAHTDSPVHIEGHTKMYNLTTHMHRHNCTRICACCHIQTIIAEQYWVCIFMTGIVPLSILSTFKKYS